MEFKILTELVEKNEITAKDVFITDGFSQEIWNQKYRFKNESQYEFYKRATDALVEGFVKYYWNDIQVCENSRLHGLNKTILHKLIMFSLANHLICTGGRIAYALGTGIETATLSNCFVIPNIKDDITEIMESVKIAAKTLQSGGGVGCYFGGLRPKGARLLRSGGSSSGSVSYMKVFDQMCDTIKLGSSRRGAQIACLPCWHPDIIDFIHSKVGKDETGKFVKNTNLTNFNISIGISDDFMEAVKYNTEWVLEYPDYEKCKKEYDSLWVNGSLNGDLKAWKKRGLPTKVYQTLPAKELMKLVIESNYNFSEPGMLFLDTINKDNPISYAEAIFTSNP